MPARAELHFHLLPGVDDGPATMEQALELARLAVADGTTTVVATPHVVMIDPEELPERVEALERRLERAGIPLEVRGGGEIAFGDVPGLDTRSLGLLSQGPDDAPWVLLEAPLRGSGGSAGDLADAAGALREQGFDVLLGHPERAPILFEHDMRALRRELDAGSVPQINATSLLGRHGPEARRRAFDVIRTAPRAVVASDAHRPTRGPALTAAMHALVDGGVPAPTAEWMTAQGPRTLLEHGLAPRATIRP